MQAIIVTARVRPTPGAPTGTQGLSFYFVTGETGVECSKIITSVLVLNDQ